MGIAVLYFAPLCLFFRRFVEVFKINFVTKSDKVQIYKKYQITNFFAENKIKREKYFKESMFLKFFDNFKNKHGILSQKFAAGVTKLLPPDEIRRFDGTFPSILNPLLSFFSPHLSFLMPLSPSLSPCPSPIISPQLFARIFRLILTPLSSFFSAHLLTSLP